MIQFVLPEIKSFKAFKGLANYRLCNEFEVNFWEFHNFTVRNLRPFNRATRE